MGEISKQQFIILAVVIIIITVGLIVLITSKAPVDESTINEEQEKALAELQIINGEDKKEEQDVEEVKEENIKDTEQVIDTTSVSEKLNKIQQRCEVVLNNSLRQIYTNMETPDNFQIIDYMGIDITKCDEYLVRMSDSKFNSDLYIILKPVPEEKEDIKLATKQFLIKYEAAWGKLNEEQYKKVVNRKAIERGGYLIYIISTDNDIILNEIRNYI